jgi:hypothetical protein
MSSDEEDDPWKRRDRELLALNKSASDILYDDDGDGFAVVSRGRTRVAQAEESDDSSSLSGSDSASSPPAKRAKSATGTGAVVSVGGTTHGVVSVVSGAAVSWSSSPAATAKRGRSPAAASSGAAAGAGRGPAAGKGRAANAKVVTLDSESESESDSDDQRGTGAVMDPALQARLDAARKKLDACSAPSLPVVLDASKDASEDEDEDEVQLMAQDVRVTSDDLVAKYRARTGGAAAAASAAAQSAAAAGEPEGVMLKFRADKDMARELALDKGAELTDVRVAPGDPLGAVFARLCSTWLKGTPRGSVIFTLDGEQLSDSVMPADEDMEDETIIDVSKIKRKPAGRR